MSKIIKTWRERKAADPAHPPSLAAGDDSYYRNCETMDLRAYIAELEERLADFHLYSAELEKSIAELESRPAAPAERMKVDIELPDDDKREVKIMWQEVRDGKLWLAVKIMGETPAAPVANGGTPAKGELLTEVHRRAIIEAVGKAWPTWFSNTPLKILNRLVWEVEQGCMASVAAPVVAEGLTCPQCGVNRLKEPCPGMADECAMKADAHLLAAHPVAYLNSERYLKLRNQGEGVEFRDSNGQWRSDCPTGEQLDAILDNAHPVAGSPAESCGSVLRQILQDYFIPETEFNSVEFDAIYGRYTDLELAKDLLKRVIAAEPMPASEAQTELVEHLRKKADSAYQFVTIDQAKLRTAADFIERAAPVPASEAANLKKLCDQLDGMKRTMFLMPGTGQHYSYLLLEDVSAYVEEARKSLAAPAAPTNAKPDDDESRRETWKDGYSVGFEAAKSLFSAQNVDNKPNKE